MNSNYYPNYSFDSNQPITWNPDPNSLYRQDVNTMDFQNMQNMNPQDERFFWAPFVVGGLAGTALGYGIANNNQINHGGNYNNMGGCCGGPVYFIPQQPMPMQPYPTMYSSNSNNFYY